MEAWLSSLRVHHGIQHTSLGDGSKAYERKVAFNEFVQWRISTVELSNSLSHLAPRSAELAHCPVRCV